MSSTHRHRPSVAGPPADRVQQESVAPRRSLLGRIVDAGLVGVPLCGPWFMGGRHPLGELVLVALAVVVTVAWLVDRALERREVAVERSRAEWVLLGAVILVLVQLAPLPEALLAILSPHTGQLLPLWSADANVPGHLGCWSQVSMTPAWTLAGLILLLAYAMLFLVAVQRLRRVADVEWLLGWIAAAVAIQAVFGIVQYLTSNGKFVWVYQHPFRDTYNAVMGAYINKNHFAHLMALGLGPLVWLVARSLQSKPSARRNDFGGPAPTAGTSLGALAAVVALSVTLFAGLMTMSRGGAAAMLVATVLVVVALYRVKTLGKRFVVAAGGACLLIGACLVIHGYSKVAERLDDYGAGSLDELDRDGARRAIWSADFQALQDYSTLGSGVGSHREIYPMYLTEPWEVEFTHAENGYLQVALETGVPGLALLAIGIVTAAVWCRRSLRRANDRRIYLASAAISAALLASVVHSLADFVWYIPSLMAITVLLLACAYRLAQWSAAAKNPQLRVSGSRQVFWSPLQCGLTACGVLVVGGWMIHDRFCAAMAEPHWDSYLRYALDARADKTPADRETFEHLESVLYWTPDNAKAHVRVASLLVTQFEAWQRQSANVMPLQQVCEAAFDSREYFHSRAELDAWLDRAIGERRRMLDRALWHLHRGLAQDALLGEAYIQLADLCFLEGASRPIKTAYLEQALQVRPNDGVVLLAAGSAAALRQDAEQVLKYWRPVLHCREEERVAMTRLLVSTQLPIEFVLEQFQPDLAATRLLYEQYAAVAPVEALGPLLAYYGQSLQQKIRLLDAESAAPLWFELHTVFHNLGRPAESIECLQRAVVSRPSDFSFRFALGQELAGQGQFAAAEPHLRWCVERKPSDGQVTAALAAAVKGRVGASDGAAATAWSQPTSSAVRK